MRSVHKSTDLMTAAQENDVSDKVKVTEMDVNVDTSVEKAIKEIIDREKRIDILVNNAGYSVFGSVEFLSMEDCQRQFNTNFFGVIRCQKAVLPFMRAQKSGRIINLSSVGGIWGQPFNDVYCASKFALE
eukprot:Pgem_evm1s14406